MKLKLTMIKKMVMIPGNSGHTLTKKNGNNINISQLKIYYHFTKV